VSRGARAFEATWRHFAATRETLGPSPGEREAWHRGRSPYAVWLLRIDVDAVHERMRAIARDLGDAIVPVPEHETHVTLFVAGFPTDEAPRHDDDVTEAVLDAQTRRLRAVATRPLPLAVGRANAFLTCAFLEVRDLDGGIATLRSALDHDAGEVRFAPYLPHVTVGRFRDSRPTDELARVLSSHRQLPWITIEARAIELVTFDTTCDGEAPLVTRCSIPLPARAVAGRSTEPPVSPSP
jgi:2'-5' RNA ligase